MGLSLVLKLFFAQKELFHVLLRHFLKVMGTQTICYLFDLLFKYSTLWTSLTKKKKKKKAKIKQTPGMYELLNPATFYKKAVHITHHPA